MSARELPAPACDSRHGCASPPAPDLTDSPLPVKPEGQALAALLPAAASAGGLTDSPLAVKSGEKGSGTHPPSVIAALTRPLWPPPVHEAPTPKPSASAGPEYPDERETRLRCERQKAQRIGPMEDPVRQFSPEDADRAAVPQVYQYPANDAQFRTAIRGRTAVDGMRKHTILTLLGVGFSLRMTAAYVGVSHQTVANVLASDPAFAEDVRQARERAKVFPLNCILRECGRSWKAATWLLEYIERKESDERSDADKHIERVRAQALAMIEKDLAKKMRKAAAKEGYPPWLGEEQKKGEP